MCKMLEEIILFYDSSRGPQLDKYILFKSLLFRKFIGRIGEKLEETNKKKRGLQNMTTVQKFKELYFFSLRKCN